MPYVFRAADGTLASLHRQAPGHPCEFLDPEHPEVQDFLGPSGADAYERLDADFIRVLEDLIDVLLRRQVIAITDLPAEAQKKLYMRKGHRKAMPLSELNLLGDSADGASAPDFDRYSA
ncbi:MAG: hypothetical protein U5L05_03970 [Rubrivivax sp.]|nr:hypothetical protein [Rubrivivax sp.]